MSKLVLFLVTYIGLAPFNNQSTRYRRTSHTSSKPVNTTFEDPVQSYLTLLYLYGFII